MGKRTKHDVRARGIQYGALAWRESPKAGVEVLLVTSLDTKRWIIPKGWPMRGRDPHQAAAREAFEEAGVKGETSAELIGSYFYDKRLPDGSAMLCRVDVFPVRVVARKGKWPEKKRRETRWFKPEEAARLVDEDDLAALLTSFRPKTAIAKERAAATAGAPE